MLISLALIPIALVLFELGPFIVFEIVVDKQNTEHDFPVLQRMELTSFFFPPSLFGEKEKGQGKRGEKENCLCLSFPKNSSLHILKKKIVHKHSRLDTDTLMN